MNFPHKTTVSSLALAAFLLGGNCGAADDKGEVEALREQIRLLDQKLRVLERKQELKDEDLAAKAKTSPTSTAGTSGFGLTSADKSYELKFKLLAQGDARLFIGDELPGNSGFLLRRVRPSLQGTVANIWDFSVVPEYAGGNATTSTTSLIDAWVAARFSPKFNVKVGKFASAVGLEPGSNRHFIESPFVNTLLPNRDLGIEISGNFAEGIIGYQLSLSNGARNNTTSLASDADDGKTLGGRFTVNPLKQSGGALANLSLGLGFSLGREEGAPQNIVTNSQQTLLNFGSLNGDGSHARLSPSLSLYSGPYSAVAEYAWEQQDIRRSATQLFEISNQAWRATFGYVLTGEESNNRGVTPKSNFDLSAGTWGAWELVARVSGIRLDDAFFNSTQGGLSAISNAKGADAYGIGVNWYLNRIVRAQLNYEYTRFDGGGSGALKHDESAVLSRLQLSF